MWHYISESSMNSIKGNEGLSAREVTVIIRKGISAWFLLLYCRKVLLYYCKQAGNRP